MFQPNAFQYTGFQIPWTATDPNQILIGRGKFGISVRTLSTGELMEDSAIYKRLVIQLTRKGKTQRKAKEIAARHLQRSGLAVGNRLTQKGQLRNRMTVEQRAFSRANVRPEDGFFYDPLKNEPEQGL